MNEATAIPNAPQTPVNDTRNDGPCDSEMHDRLRSAADAAAKWDVVPRPSTASAFPKRVRAAREALRNLEDSLARFPIADVPTDPELLARRSAVLELSASHRAFRSAISSVSDKPHEIAKLPRIVRGRRQDER